MADLAVRLTILAIRLAFLAPGLASAGPPFRGAHPEALPERPGENVRARVTVVQGDFRDGRFRMKEEGRGRQLGPPPLDISVERLSRQGAENPVKVKTGEMGRPGELLEAEVPADVAVDEVEDPVDAGPVFGSKGFRSVKRHEASFFDSSGRRCGLPALRNGIIPPESRTRGSASLSAENQRREGGARPPPPNVCAIIPPDSAVSGETSHEAPFFHSRHFVGFRSGRLQPSAGRHRFGQSRRPGWRLSARTDRSGRPGTNDPASFSHQFRPARG